MKFHFGNRLTAMGTLIEHDDVCAECGNIEAFCECGRYRCQVCTEAPGWPIEVPFGWLCSRIAQINQALNDPMFDYAPSECYRDAANHTDRQVRQLLAENGYTVDSFAEELARRTSAKYAYFSGLVPHSSY